MVCGLLCLQLSRVLFSQCQSAANGSVGAGLHFFSILLFPSNGCIQMQPRMTPAAQDKRMQIKRRLLQFVAFSITLIIPQHQTSSEPPENSMLGRIDPLWSERVSTQQCCASDFVSVCKMKVVSGSHRGSLSCLWHKGLASECLLPKKMLESEEENILRQRVLSHSVLESFREREQQWPFCDGKSLLVKLNKYLLQKLFLRKYIFFPIRKCDLCICQKRNLWTCFSHLCQQPEMPNSAQSQFPPYPCCSAPRLRFVRWHQVVRVSELVFGWKVRT